MVRGRWCTLLALLAVTAACSSDEAARDTPVDPPSTAASTGPPSPAGPDGIRVAVMHGDGGLALYRVDPGTRAAEAERELQPPVAGAEVFDVAMTRGAEPAVCATWHTGTDGSFGDRSSRLVCYREGDTAGVAVAEVQRAADVALTPDGTRLAWSELSPGELNSAVGTAVLEDGVVSQVQRLLADQARPEVGGEAFTGTDVQDLAWLDASTLLVSTVVQSDDGPDVLRVDVSGDSRGWLRDGVRIEQPDPDYHAFDSVASASADGTALALQRGYDLADERPPSRAVRIDVRTGEVVRVLATAAEDRDVTSVSGDEDAVVYVTSSAVSESPGARAYLRLADDDRGQRITGLPDDVVSVRTAG